MMKVILPYFTILTQYNLQGNHFDRFLFLTDLPLHDRGHLHLVLELKRSLSQVLEAVMMKVVYRAQSYQHTSSLSQTNPTIGPLLLLFLISSRW